MGFQPTRFDPPARLGLFGAGQQSRGDRQDLPAAADVELEIVRGAARHTRRKVTGKVFLIGSACDCDLVLGDEQFPEAYAYLFLQDGEVTVRHLGSGPAVMVDGERVQARRLQDGDVLECGPYAFRLVIRQPEPRGRKDRSQGGPHFALAAEKSEQSHSLKSADDVLGLRVAREEVSRLLADIAAALDIQTEEVKLLPWPEPKPASSLLDQMRRRASA